MGDDKFCCADDFPVLIPYRDLVRFVETARNIERFSERLSRTDKQLAALRGLYSELLEKVGDLERMA